jgi:hypothetical protein
LQDKKMRLVQFRDEEGNAAVAVVEDNATLVPLRGVASVRDLAKIALADGTTLASAASAHMGDARIDYEDVARSRRSAIPIRHIFWSPVPG